MEVKTADDSSGFNTPSLPILSPLTTTNSPGLATPSLPVLSPQVNTEGGPTTTHSNMTTPSLPSLSPSSTLPTTVLPALLSPPGAAAARIRKEGRRRDSGEGKLMRPDPEMATPLSVLIPPARARATPKRSSPRGKQHQAADKLEAKSSPDK